MNSSVDWSIQLALAKEGKFDEIDPGVYIRNHSSINRIAAENARPKYRKGNTCEVHWGVTGSGKSHGVFEKLENSGEPYYVKNANTKWWDGYRGQKHVVIDEFTGRIDISYLLCWLDCYPTMAEVKGSIACLAATHFYIMSNLSPMQWYASENSGSATPEQVKALIRRLTMVKEYTEKYVMIPEFNIDLSLDSLLN